MKRKWNDDNIYKILVQTSNVEESQTEIKSRSKQVDFKVKSDWVYVVERILGYERISQAHQSLFKWCSYICCGIFIFGGFFSKKSLLSMWE